MELAWDRSIRPCGWRRGMARRGRDLLGLCHFAHARQLGKALLAQSLVSENGHGVGQVQTPGVRAHGDAQTPVVIPLPEGLGKPGGLLTEEQPAAIPEPGLSVVPGGLGGGQPQVGVWILTEQSTMGQ